MAVFITGGHGHIASWTARFLAEAGEQVILYDINPISPDCLSGVSRHVEFIQGDVMDFPRLTEIFRGRKEEIDGIIHTVGIMGEIVLTNPHGNVKLNIAGTHNILEIARLFDIPKVVYTSTGAVYGALPGIATEKEHQPNPADLYAATKVSCEFLGQQYANTFGIDFRISRIYFCYGPGKLPSNFIRLYQLAFGALEGLLDLRTDKGSDQKLDFVYVEDAARGTALVYQAEKPKYSVFNIATGISTSVGDVVKLSQKYSRFNVEVELGPGKLMQRCEALDISRARKVLGYEPKFNLEQGIQRYADWLYKAGTPFD